jgi:hypothetical protein
MSKKYKKYKLTKKHLEIYEQAAMPWLSILGLSEWRVYFELMDLESAYACCSADLEGRVVLLGLAKVWHEPITKKKLIDSARHEVLELLLQPMWHAVLARSLDVDWAEGQRHAIVRRLEAMLDVIAK